MRLQLVQGHWLLTLWSGAQIVVDPAKIHFDCQLAPDGQGGAVVIDGEINIDHPAVKPMPLVKFSYFGDDDD